MKHSNLRKTWNAVLFAGGSIVAVAALAETPPQIAAWTGSHCGNGAGMVPGMMGRQWGNSDLKLTPEQRRKLNALQDDQRRKHWTLMGAMHDEQARMDDLYEADARDDAAIAKTHRNLLDLRQQMFELSLATQRQIDAVLNREQREQMRRR